MLPRLAPAASVQKIPSKAKSATSPRKAPVMSATVRTTSPTRMGAIGYCLAFESPCAEFMKA